MCLTRVRTKASGSAGAPAAAVSTTPKVASTPAAPWSNVAQAAPQVAQAAPSSELRVIDLNNVNISDPDF